MNNWTEINNKLQKEFQFENFLQALDFVNKVGKIAESSQHHPDIQIHSYNKVLIQAQTHDQGHIVTQKDHDLANLIDNINA